MFLYFEISELLVQHKTTSEENESDEESEPETTSKSVDLLRSNVEAAISSRPTPGNLNDLSSQDDENDPEQTQV